MNPRQMAKKNRNKCNVTVQNCLNQVHLKVIMINITPILAINGVWFVIGLTTDVNRGNPSVVWSSIFYPGILVKRPGKSGCHILGYVILDVIKNHGIHRKTIGKP